MVLNGTPYRSEMPSRGYLTVSAGRSFIKMKNAMC